MIGDQTGVFCSIDPVNAFGIVRKNEVTPDLKRDLTHQPKLFALGNGLRRKIRLDKDFQSVADRLRVLVAGGQKCDPLEP